MLVFSTLSAWLRDVGISLTEIGFFAWLVLTYSLKFLWAPFVDRYSVICFRIFGKRRGWILFSQFMIFMSLHALKTRNFDEIKCNGRQKLHKLKSIEVERDHDLGNAGNADLITRHDGMVHPDSVAAIVNHT